jgi:cytochrome c-type biogenesis protein
MGELISSGSLLLAIPIAIAAGLVSFLSPCVLPLAPGYVSYVTGLTAAQFSGTPEPGDRSVWVRRRTIIVGTALFVAGFTAVFVSFGLLFGGLGATLLTYQVVITRILGLAVVALGIAYLIGVPALNREWRSHHRPRRGLWGAPVLGVVFGLGWAPCIGPVLAVVQTLAFTQASAARGALLSVAYCVGLGMPFLLVGLTLDKALSVFSWARRHTPLLMRMSGAAMVVIGLLLVTGVWSDITIWMRVQIGGFQPVL